MYAIFEHSGLQYTAEEGTVLKVPFLHVDSGSKIDFDSVLLVKQNDRIIVGTPLVSGAKIEAEVLANGLSDKVRVYKYKHRTKYRRTRGQRRHLSEIRINKIVALGE